MPSFSSLGHFSNLKVTVHLVSNKLTSIFLKIIFKIISREKWEVDLPLTWAKLPVAGQQTDRRQYSFVNSLLFVCDYMFVFAFFCICSRCCSLTFFVFLLCTHKVKKHNIFIIPIPPQNDSNQQDDKK